MKPETIKAIFTNLLFVIGVILSIIGFVQGTRTVVKLVVFPKYPLDTYEETKCEQTPYAPVPLAVDKSLPVVEDSTSRQTKDDCKTQLETERKVRLTEDIVGSISMLTAGAFLIFFFRKYILK